MKITSETSSGLLVGRHWRNASFDDKLLLSPNGTALPGQEAQSAASNATIDKEGNIVSPSHYWKKEADGSYTAKNLPLPPESPATTDAKSANHTQVIEGIAKQWTLVARPGIKGLLVSQNNGAFALATKRFGTKSMHAVTRQGWIFDEEYRAWTGETWATLLELLGSDYTQAELLGINDEGLAVAKIQQAGEDMKIGLLIPSEVVQGLLGSESEDSGDWLTSEANPVPSVDMQVVSAVVSGSGVSVSVTGTVLDEISRYGNASEKLQSL